MQNLKFDFNNMFSFNVSKKHGVTENEVEKMVKAVQKAHKHLGDLINHPENRVNLGLEWVKLPFQDRSTIGEIQKLGEEISKNYENLISLGIGGSYLGLKAAQDALCPPYYNDFGPVRKGRPRIYFEGNNLDPDTLSVLLRNLNPKKTFITVISKSGETTETKVAFSVVESWLKKEVGKEYGHQIFVITDPKSGTLRKKVIREQKKDILSFRNLPLLEGVGGRYSELNMGLLHLAIIGVNIKELFEGARAMAKRCSADSVYKNPAYMYATLQTILYRKKDKFIAVMMPFSERLKSTADWYAQLLAESLGKKYQRKIRIGPSGMERWVDDKNRIVNVGRTPLPCRGTNDLHSVHQNNIEGENNKTVTFIRVENFKGNIKTPQTGDFLSGKSCSELIKLAQEATEWSLVREKRPNCTIVLPEITPYSWGELVFFFEMATAFEGELLNINAFNQPGVEGYKNYMYYKLHKEGISRRVATDIRKYPLVKKSKFIV